MKINACKGSKTTGGEAAFFLFQAILPRAHTQKSTLGKQKMNLLIRDKLLALHFRGKQSFLDAFYLYSSNTSS